jgi:hypothetical protein
MLVSLAASAEDAKKNAELLGSAPNGCGAGWTVYLVPDSIPLFRCTFRAACDGHDNCYGKCSGRALDTTAPECEYLRCKAGGDLFNSAQCKTSIRLTKLAVEAQARRKTCDLGLGSAIVANNIGRPVCQAFGYAYEKAVRSFGNPNFQGLDNVASTLKQPKEEYEAAIREFFRKGTDAEFAKFNANPPSFELPLKYVEGRGLINDGTVP